MTLERFSKEELNKIVRHWLAKPSQPHDSEPHKIVPAIMKPYDILNSIETMHETQVLGVSSTPPPTA
jgi:hypothetical protein